MCSDGATGAAVSVALGRRWANLPPSFRRRASLRGEEALVIRTCKLAHARPARGQVSAPLLDAARSHAGDLPPDSSGQKWRRQPVERPRFACFASSARGVAARRSAPPTSALFSACQPDEKPPALRRDVALNGAVVRRRVVARVGSQLVASEPPRAHRSHPWSVGPGCGYDAPTRVPAHSDVPLPLLRG